MKKLVLLILLLTTFASCGQKKEQLKNTEEMQTALIEKYTEKIWSEMKQYEVQPAYYLRLYHTNCTFQVLVNGLKAYEGDSLEKLGSAVFINRFILKSGKQEVIVRMYPLGTLLQEEYGEETYDDILTLLPQSNVEVKVTYIADLKRYESPSKDEKTLLIYNSPVDNQKNFIGKGLPYYEYSFEFDAKVPYEFEGWSNGVDLSTVNQEELKGKLLVLNDKLRQMYLNKDGEGIIKLFLKSKIRTSESQYNNKEDVKQELELLTTTIYKEKESVSINKVNLELNFTFKNRLISQRVTNDLLKSRTLEIPETKGFSSVIFIDEYGRGIGIMNYFYMPKEYEGKEIHLEYMP